MDYIESNLMPGERIIYKTRLHWAIFLGPIVLFLIGLLFVGSPDGGGAGGFFIALAILWGIGALINFNTTEFGVTNRRVIAKSGFLRRHSMEILLNRVESISVDQGIMGRILGYGTIVVGGTGGTKEKFAGIANPFPVRQSVNEQIEGQRA